MDWCRKCGFTMLAEAAKPSEAGGQPSGGITIVARATLGLVPPSATGLTSCRTARSAAPSMFPPWVTWPWRPCTSMLPTNGAAATWLWCRRSEPSCRPQPFHSIGAFLARAPSCRFMGGWSRSLFPSDDGTFLSWRLECHRLCHRYEIFGGLHSVDFGKLPVGLPFLSLPCGMFGTQI